MVSYKSPHEIEIMREAGRVVAYALERVAGAAAPGVTLAELDAVAARAIKERGAQPTFLDYKPAFGPTPFPATVCLSVNDVVVHGIPDGRALAEGDLLSIDCGAAIDGYQGDAAITVSIGPADAEAERLMRTTVEALERAIGAARPGGRLGDIDRKSVV